MEVAKTELFEFIGIWYNRQRIHSILGYLTSEEYGKSITKQAA
ncbi:IS3 family transposase [Chitinophaga sp. LS1]